MSGCTGRVSRGSDDVARFPAPGNGMSRRPAKFTQADIARAIRAANQSDVKMAVEISPDGTIRIIPAEQSQNVRVEPHPDIRL